MSRLLRGNASRRKDYASGQQHLYLGFLHIIHPNPYPEAVVSRMHVHPLRGISHGYVFPLPGLGLPI